MVEKTIYRKTINWYAFYKIFATFSDKKSMFFSGEKQLFLKKKYTLRIPIEKSYCFSRLLRLIWF